MACCMESIKERVPFAGFIYGEVIPTSLAHTLLLNHPLQDFVFPPRQRHRQLLFMLPSFCWVPVMYLDFWPMETQRYRCQSPTLKAGRVACAAGHGESCNAERVAMLGHREGRVLHLEISGNALQRRYSRRAFRAEFTRGSAHRGKSADLKQRKSWVFTCNGKPNSNVKRFVAFCVSKIFPQVTETQTTSSLKH